VGAGSQRAAFLRAVGMKALRDLWRETTRAERLWFVTLLLGEGLLGAFAIHLLTGGGR